ncbi:hypothetical protein [Natronosalvus amylolyticus]|uniref:hypothetical protein n=1 Tax=Natronosalvus amylolyticus TaxID=2961994 RepID=UPI0020C980F1|nr:hypothetical protein [Natronosalvus amylolyticus]
MSERDGIDRVDEFFKLEHTQGVIWVARRGITAIKAADFDEDGTIYPILYDRSKLERKEREGTIETVPREDVPERVETYLEGQFYAVAKNLEMLRQAGGS